MGASDNYYAMSPEELLHSLAFLNYENDATVKSQMEQSLVSKGFSEKHVQSWREQFLLFSSADCRCQRCSEEIVLERSDLIAGHFICPWCNCEQPIRYDELSPQVYPANLLSVFSRSTDEKILRASPNTITDDDLFRAIATGMFTKQPPILFRLKKMFVLRGFNDENLKSWRPAVPKLPAESVIGSVVRGTTPSWLLILGGLFQIAVATAIGILIACQQIAHDAYKKEFERANNSFGVKTQIYSENCNPYRVLHTIPWSIAAVMLLGSGVLTLSRISRLGPENAAMSSQERESAKQALSKICSVGVWVFVRKMTSFYPIKFEDVKFTMCNSNGNILFISNNLNDYFAIKKCPSQFASTEYAWNSKQQLFIFSLYTTNRRWRTVKMSKEVLFILNDWIKMDSPDTGPDNHILPTDTKKGD